MSNLKDTDFDDLFRRASEKYPLRTDSSDWDGMSAALEKDPPSPGDGTDTNDRRKKRRFFWLFFLLPLGVGGLGYYAWHSGARTKIGVATNAAVATKTPGAAGSAKPDGSSTGSTPDAGSAKPDGSSTGSTPGAGSTASTSTSTRAASTTAGSGTSATINTPVTTTPVASPAGEAQTTTGINSNHRSNVGRQANGGPRHQTSAGPLSDDNDAFAHANTKVNGNGSVNGNGTVNGSANGNGTVNGNANGNGTVSANGKGSGNGTVNVTGSANAPVTGSPFSASIAQNQQDRLFYDLQRAPIDRNYQLRVNVTAPAAKKDSSATKPKASPKAKTSYFYAGILGAPDLSTVKMQAVKGVGNTFGVLLGYAFNPHWAIETGAYLDRKRYYTEGEYFNTEAVKLPANATLNSVDGTCYMWEIPLNIRYNFNPAGKTRWFAVAGFSTYLMSSEKYSYAYEAYGGGTSWAGDSYWTIKKPSQYPFSIINVSGGFEQRLGKVGNLRIEPYLRIPLTGMGTGKLPIMSTGINIGITRQLW